MNKIGNFESSTKKIAKILLLSALLSILVLIGESVWLDVPPSGTKCVSEEIQGNVVVLGDYLIISEDPAATILPTISVKVTSPYGNNLHHVDNVSHGEFAFTTKESGNYMACFWADPRHHGNNISININWKTGIAAKDWDAIAKKEKITGVELEIRKLEFAIESIHENLLYIRNREAEMRIVSEKTNSRVAWCSMMSLAICIAVSGLQVAYLKQYFRKKKLI